MANLSMTDVIKKVKSGEICNYYYFYGKDVMSIEAITKTLIKKLTKSVSDAYTQIDGKSLNLSEISDLIELYPMFTEYNCILINDLNAEDLNADNLKYFLKILENIPEKTIIIMNVTGFDLKDGKRTVSSKNKKVIDFIAKVGIVCEINYKSVPELAKLIIEKVSKNGCSISKDNAGKIAELFLCDSIMINNEVEKLCAYAGESEITYKIIRQLVSKQIDSNAFALAKAVTALKAGEAMQVLDELMSQRTEAVVVLSAVSSAFIDLYRTRTALSHNIKQQEVIDDFNYKGREFIVRNAFNSCGKISSEQFRECLIILRDTDEALKSTRTDSRILIEKAIIEMMIVAEK